MKIKEIRNFATGEIETKLTNARQEYMNLRFQFVTGQLTDTSRLKQTRHLIARFETILRERELAGKEG